MSERIYLAPPHMSGREIEYVQQAFDENWIAPAGPQLALFEERFCQYTGAACAVAVSSGTAALHLALIVLGIHADDEVMVSTLTFAGSVNPLLYVGARPVFIDSDPASWNMDANLLAEALRLRAQMGRLPKAVIPVHLYGQAADMDAIMSICSEYNIPVIEDAAESLGSTYHDRHPGTIGKMGMFSFNGNKIITTSGGGILVSNDKSLVDHARKLSTQAREPFAHYEHVQVGYNYRMSNILAAIGCEQLNVIEDRVRRKREIYAYYQAHLGTLPGLSFVDEMSYGRHTHWLSTVLVDPAHFGYDREQIRLRLEQHNIESRPMWKPMHLQPVFKGFEFIGGSVAKSLFDEGLCLPSGTTLTQGQLARIVAIISDMCRN